MGHMYKVDAQWEPEAGVWVAESEDVPGLVTEAPSLNILQEKLNILIPELLELNGAIEPGQKEVKFHIHAHHEHTSSVTVAY
jgi:hypothetical protein